MTFSEKLVKLRKRAGISQDEFACAVGVSRQAVYKWESGQSYPEVAKLLEIKLLFSISIDDLLDENYEVVLPEKPKRKRRASTEAKKAAPAPAKEAPKAEPTPAPVAEAPKAEPAPAPVAEAPKAEPAPAPVKEAPKAEPTPAPVAEAPKAEPAPAAEEPASETEKKRSILDRIFGSK